MNPKQKEIVEALRQAADAYNRLYLSASTEGRNIEAISYWKDKALEARNLAAEVEQMRCKNCAMRYRINGFTSTECPGVDLGNCWHWKPKEVKNG